MHTVAISRKANLLEALDELFSQENLYTYQITENDWQDLFLILLNSYLRSNSINRREIFKRLSDKLHELKNREHQRPTNLFPSISAASLSTNNTRNTLIALDLTETKRTSYHFGKKEGSI